MGLTVGEGWRGVLDLMVREDGQGCGSSARRGSHARTKMNGKREVSMQDQGERYSRP